MLTTPATGFAVPGMSNVTEQTFTVTGGNIIVNQLGVSDPFDLPANLPVGPVTVTLSGPNLPPSYLPTLTPVLGSITAGGPSTITGGFEYKSIVPVTLYVGNTYTITTNSAVGTVAHPTSIDVVVYNITSDLVGPNISLTGGVNSYLPYSSLSYTTPEPSTLVIWSLVGGSGLFLAARHRRKTA